MGSLLRRRPSHATLVAYLALFVALGGSAYAALKVGSKQIADNSVRSVDIHNNTVRSKDVRNGGLRAKDFKAGQLPAGEKGDPGPEGPKGDQGDPGVSPATFWAVVSETSAVVRSKGGATINRTAPGVYEITFPDQGLSGCAAIASISATEADGNLQPGEAGAHPSSTVASQVNVATRNSSGAFADKPFEVAVFC